MHRFSAKSLIVAGVISTLFLLISTLFPQIAYAHVIGYGQSNVSPGISVSCGSPDTGKFDSFYAYAENTDNGWIHIYDTTIQRDYLTIQSTTSAPALACWKSNLIVAWRAGNGSDQLFVGNFTCRFVPRCDIPNPTSFSNATTSNAPAFTSDNNNMYLGWVGKDGSHHLNLLVLLDLIHYSNLITFTDYTRDGAGLALSHDMSTNKIWVSWVASSGTPHIYLGYLNGTNSQLVDQPPFSDYASSAPSIYANNGYIRFVWKGYTNANIYTDHWDGSWHPSIKQRDTTIDRPVIDGTTGPTTIATAFTGTDNTVYYDENAYRY